jgi:hypothetical protein
MLQKFEFINSEIGSNQLELLTQFGIVRSNVTNNSIDIANNIFAINSSISEMITNLESNVLLVNDSIYTAVFDVSTQISIDSDNIIGNISLTYEQNEFLTELFKETMFSELLNWSGVGYNYSLIENQIDSFQFISNFRNASVELELKYLDQIEKIRMNAQDVADMMLPNLNVSYRVYSLDSNRYLDDWKPIEDNKINFGYDDYVYGDVYLDNNITSADFIIASVIIAAASIFVYYYIKKSKPLRSNENSEIEEINEVTNSYAKNIRGR